MRNDVLMMNPEGVDILGAQTPDLVSKRLTQSKNADYQRMVNNE